MSVIDFPSQYWDNFICFNTGTDKGTGCGKENLLYIATGKIIPSQLVADE